MDGTTPYCSMSIVKRWVYTLCDCCCEPANIKMKEGIHYPFSIPKKKHSVTALAKSFSTCSISERSRSTTGRISSMSGVRLQFWTCFYGILILIFVYSCCVLFIFLFFNLFRFYFVFLESIDFFSGRKTWQSLRLQFVAKRDFWVLFHQGKKQKIWKLNNNFICLLFRFVFLCN